jgi:hypothetical protein
MYVLYLTLLHQPTLRLHCVGGCWDRTQDFCDFGIGSQIDGNANLPNAYSPYSGSSPHPPKKYEKEETGLKTVKKTFVISVKDQAFSIDARG